MQVLLRQLRVGADPAEVRRARDWVRRQLAGGAVGSGGSGADTVVLLVSELVTNAVVHTGRPAVLRLLLPAPGEEVSAPLRLEVADGSRRAPRRRTAKGEDTGGRGLELVELLADRWGWHREGEGKRIWCELDLADCAAARPGHKVPASY